MLNLDFFFERCQVGSHVKICPFSKAGFYAQGMCHLLVLERKYTFEMLVRKIGKPSVSTMHFLSDNSLFKW